nr:peptide chain release factor 2 [Natranaerofaba carboxydovora]
MGEVKTKLNGLCEELDEMRVYLDPDSMNKRIEELEKEMTEEGFWDDQQRAKNAMEERNRLKEKVKELENLDEQKDEILVLLELIDEGEADFDEVINSLKSFEKDLEKLTIKNMLSEKHDTKNAFLTLHAGAGGTESQDWVEMLLRMYTRFAEHKGYEIETMDILPGDDAGIKSATILLKGQYAYGYLKAERGVHRLVRVSPFDSSGRRHTSFASVDVVPEIDDDIEVEVKPDEVKMDTYRASGAGGQHVNTTDSAVRLTHLPTGTVVQCQNQRSQHKNKEQAFKILRSKLAAKQLEEKEKEREQLRGEKKEIAWGSQIRSYTFHPFKLIKDHRTGYEEPNVDKVMDGDLEPFIESYLKQEMKT